MDTSPLFWKQSSSTDGNVALSVTVNVTLSPKLGWPSLLLSNTGGRFSVSDPLPVLPPPLLPLECGAAKLCQIATAPTAANTSTNNSTCAPENVCFLFK